MKNILYLPLDERFATRDSFIHLSKLTPFNLLTPPAELLPKMKTPPNMDRLHNWVDQQIGKADILIISAEMFLYGGLINSRLSMDKLEVIKKRLAKLKEYKDRYPELEIYLSTVIMRIPAYDLDIEEPHYWQDYGKAIFDYSFYSHKYQVEGYQKDKRKADEIKSDIPQEYLDEFIWRRERNHKVTRQILDYQNDFNLFEEIYITLDDNAPYGFNIKEEKILRKIVKNYSLENVNIYPGADEVGLTILAKFATKLMNQEPKIQIIYRDPQANDLVPNYEGQPLSRSIQAQIKGNGGQIVSNNPDIILLVNNFSQPKQLEARVQKDNELDEYNIFQPFVQKNAIIGLADVRYSNGGDLSFVKWSEEQFDSLEKIAYAGWNTNGNTLGTVIANTILLYLFNQHEDNLYFNTLRFLEDLYYQADIRTDLMNYINKTDDSIFDLSNDLDFYNHFVTKRIESDLDSLKENYDIPYQLDNIFFPWTRTFEIGIQLREDS